MNIQKTPWGDEIISEIPIFKGQHSFVARALKKNNGDRYIDISKYGPKPVAGEYYRQSLRLFKLKHWNDLRFAIESLSELMDWNLDSDISKADINSIEKLKNKLKSTKATSKRKGKKLNNNKK